MELSSKIAFSIVSHGQGDLVRLLLNDLDALQDKNFEVIITLNLPEKEDFLLGYNFEIIVLRNLLPKGFGANHNAAFLKSSCEWFAVVNPDVRIKELNLQVLLSPFKELKVKAVAPLIFSSRGLLEDSARRFPTIFRLVKRIFLRMQNVDYSVGEEPYQVDWVAGMFVVFRHEMYEELGGFDDLRFYMYLEDADICRRIALKHGKVVVNPKTEVIHDARRKSHKDLTHLRWHLVSAVRYLIGL